MSIYNSVIRLIRLRLLFSSWPDPTRSLQWVPQEVVIRSQPINQQMGKIKFGTDGWRAVIAEDFTFKNVARVAQAAADFWKANPVPNTEQKVIIGYDRRFLSNEFGRSAADVFVGNGFQVVLAPE